MNHCWGAKSHIQTHSLPQIARLNGLPERAQVWFGTGNKEHQQIIEQTEAFLNAYGLSRFAPFPYSPADLPIKDLAGYRQRGEHDESPMIFYTFPATFEKEIACGFNAKQFAEVLKKAGMLTPPNSGRGYQRKSPRIQGRQINVYVLNYQPGDYNSSEE